MALFEKYKVLSAGELHSRYEIYLEIYAKRINIEALASIDMVKKQYIPAVIQYTGELAKTIGRLKNVSAPTIYSQKKNQASALLFASLTKNLN